MFPRVFTIGDFFLPTYGVLVALGFLAGLWVASKLARRAGLDPDKVVNVGVYGALAGLLGAKLLMFVVDFDYYRQNPGEIFSLSTLQAGGVFYGGFVLALVAGIYLIKRWNLPAATVLDCLAPGVALGQAIGRLGCFAAGCCWGEACDRAWAVTFRDPEAHRLVGVPLGVAVHPTQLYEAAAGFLIFAVLWRMARRKHAPGTLIGWYLVLSSAARFVVEFVRHHEQPNPLGGPLSSQQWIALGLFAIGAIMLARLKQQRAATSPAH
jgi:phosphatidylglycerol:prolipoprotein diacylglycerol transferase